MAFLRACLNELRGLSGEGDGICLSFPASPVGRPLQASGPHPRRGRASEKPGWCIAIPSDSPLRRLHTCEAGPHAIRQ